MALMPSDQVSPFVIFHWIIIGILGIVSFLGNGFITMVNVLQGIQNRKMSTCDFLLTCLSTSRLLTQLISVVHYFAYLFSSSSTMEMALFLWIYLNMASLWSASWLNIFYCVKVTNFANSFFLWIKSRNNLLLPRLLGISMLIFMVSSLPSVFSYFRNKEPCNLTIIPPNTTCQGKTGNNLSMTFRPLQLIFTCINFFMNLAASLLLLTSLWRHVRNLRKNGTSVQDLSTQVHLKVMKVLLTSLFFYLLFIAGMIITAGDFYQFKKGTSLVAEIMMSIFPSVHPIILIWTNSRLKEVATHFLNIRERVA